MAFTEHCQMEISQLLAYIFRKYAYASLAHCSSKLNCKSCLVDYLMKKLKIVTELDLCYQHIVSFDL